MSQIVGRQLPIQVNEIYPANKEYHPVSVHTFDSVKNSALVTAAVPYPLTTKVDVASGTVTYTGICSPAVADVNAAVWLIKRVTVAGNVTTTEYAYVPAAGSAPARYATAEHVWASRASLNYQ